MVLSSASGHVFSPAPVMGDSGNVQAKPASGNLCSPRLQRLLLCQNSSAMVVSSSQLQCLHLQCQQKKQNPIVCLFYYFDSVN
uniref:Uncharacterized protein n=1 Tax=Ditylenchus dipsaci TaxID=166011 RepID=A0A915E3V3_9BILA